jgi:hypothetical protein
LRKVHLAVVAVSIVVAAVSLGVTLTRYLGLRAYSPKGAAQAAATPGERNVPVAPAEEWNNLFAPGDGMKMASRLPAVNAKTGSQASHTAFLLVGTIVSSTPSARRAILWATGMKLPKAFREKEEVEPGAILASIERDKVWITRGTEREKLEILPVEVAYARRDGAPAVAPGRLRSRSPSPLQRPRQGGGLSAPPTGRWPPKLPPAPRMMRRRVRGNGASGPRDSDGDGTRRC